MLESLIAAATFAGIATTPATDFAALSSRAGEVADRFEKSRTATVTRSLGWRSGRCYTMNDPNRAYGAAFIVETRAPDRNNDGPIFDRPLTKMVIATHNPGSNDPEYFDNPTSSLRREIDNYVDRVMVDQRFSEIFYDRESLSSIWDITRYDARSDGEFHYVRVGSTRTGQDFAYCYFFKKIN